MMLIDPAGRMSRWNPAAAALLDIDPGAEAPPLERFIAEADSHGFDRLRRSATVGQWSLCVTGCSPAGAARCRCARRSCRCAARSAPRAWWS
ncbi:MAG: hypothetical protein MZW92_16570 [Comamonadaceae bacterium]|nr:hypothetical protein [Comamonadaceae bacterium]